MSDDNRVPFVFEGFQRPASNWYRQLNGWFDLVIAIRTHLGADPSSPESDSQVRIISELKLFEYIIRHTWGYQQFTEARRLTYDEIRNGRFRRNGQRFDSGTGLSPSSIAKASARLQELGLLLVERDDHDAARQRLSYRPRLVSDDDEPVWQTDEPSAFDGFEVPQANFFPIPDKWTDQMRGMRSEAQILAVEYQFRHCWGWQGDDQRPKWMTADQIANGRQYRDGRRYDRGIGFHHDTVRRACDALVERGFFVARDRKNEQERIERQYTLRLRGRAMLDEDDGAEDRPEVVELTNGSVAPGDDPKGPGDGSVALSDESVVLNDGSVVLNDRSVERSQGDTLSVDTSRDTNEEQQQQQTLVPAPAPAATAGATAAAAVVADLPLAGLLDVYRITDPMRRRILQARPDRKVVLAWMLYVESEPGLTKKAGYLIERLLDENDRQAAPPPFQAFASLGSADWRELATASRYAQWTGQLNLPRRLERIWRDWSEVYGGLAPEELPLGLGQAGAVPGPDPPAPG